MKSFIQEIENKFDEIEEANVTANLDGGAGPPKVPGAFSKVKDEDKLNGTHIEVLGYKKSKKSKKNFSKLESLEKKIENKINEITYSAYVHDDSRKNYQKINDSIKKINRMMFEIEQIVNQNNKLKKEAGIHTNQYWKSTQYRLGKISERMIRVSQKIKELSV